MGEAATEWVDSLTRIHPARNYLKYHFLFAEDSTLEGACQALRLLGFASVSRDEYLSISAEVGNPPASFLPLDRSHSVSAKYLRKHQIFGLLHPDSSIEEMYKVIFGFPRVRETVERLILGGVDEKEAVFRLKKLSIRLGSRAYADYRHYFWGGTHMGTTDWSLYFENDDSGRISGSRQNYDAALHCGKDVALFRCGIRREINTQEALVEMAKEVHTTFLEVQSLPVSTNKVLMLSHLVRSMSSIDKRLKEGDSALRDTLKQFSRFKLNTDSTALPTLADLAPTGSASNSDKLEIAKRRDSA